MKFSIDYLDDYIYKMKFLGVLLLFLISSFSIGQNWQVTSVPANADGQRFDDVFFLDENVGWAANGFFASVYKTTDGGLTWQEQLNENSLEGNQYFRNIEFLNPEIGFLGTLNGNFYKTIDGGNTWSEIINISPTPPAICGLETVGLNTIFGCGAFFQPAYIIKSSDSGETWSYRDMSLLANALVEIQFANENTGYAAGSDENGAVILKTIDGGESWTKIFNSGIAGEYVWKLQIMAENPNLIFGVIESIEPNNGQLIKSNDGGLNWISLDTPETHIQAVGFISPTTGWVGGHTTGFQQTMDGGATWEDLGIGSNLNRIFIVDNNLAFAAGTGVYKFTSETLGIDTYEESASRSLNIKLDQNPVEQNLSFTIDFKHEDNILIELYDIQGRLLQSLDRQIIQQSNITVDFNYNVEHLKSGVYFLNIHNNFNRESLKFVKR